MTPKHRPGPFGTRPLEVQPPEIQPLDVQPLDVRSRAPQTLGGAVRLDPRSDELGSEANDPAETGFVGGFRTEPDPADEPTPGETTEDILDRPPTMRDVGDELAAPPRRRLPVLTLALGSGALLAVGFLAGVQVQKDHGSTTSAAGGARAGASGAAAYGGRAPGGAGQQGTGQQGAGQQGAPGAAGTASTGVTTGTVKVVDNSFIYVSDSSGNILKVKTDTGTRIQVTRDGKTVDLKPGDTVVVRGATGDDGSIAATSVSQGTAGAGRAGAPGGQG
ncbi:hypothetical protein [Streptomyces sp. SID3343]|uniref:hypothetical protein n=1 Tax=Streptomyces sp. SID3343 TaxID=2690260 RepID=UPI00136C9A5F|nr:hypothetical protein [Streptomyces sp. SID3343]MYW03151.1 hypothetical protein [Streptomyces sp. SID3343]